MDRVYDVGGGNDAIFGDLSIAGCGRRSYPVESGVTVYLGGTTHKSQIDFQKEFRKLTEKIQSTDANLEVRCSAAVRNDFES